MIRAVPGGFEVYIPRWMRKDNPKVRAFIQKSLEELRVHFIPMPPTKTSQDEILAMVDVLWPRIGVRPKRVQFRQMTRKWGSCSSRENITLSTGLTWLPSHLAEYVVCHELVHLRVHNHSKDFWNGVAALMPDYKRRMDWLKKNSGLMTWFS